MQTQMSFYDLNYETARESIENIIEFPVKKVFKLDKPKPKPADSVKTLEEIEQIKKYFLDRKGYRNYCLFIIGITTGYRISDLLSLKFSDFFEDYKTWKREIDIVEQKTKKRRTIQNKLHFRKAFTVF